MKKSVRQSITDKTLERLNPAKPQLTNISVLHSLTAYLEQPETFIASIQALYNTFLGALVEDERGILQNSTQPFSFSDLCRITLVNFFDPFFEHSIKDCVDEI